MTPEEKLVADYAETSVPTRGGLSKARVGITHRLKSRTGYRTARWDPTHSDRLANFEREKEVEHSVRIAKNVLRISRQGTIISFNLNKLIGILRQMRRCEVRLGSDSLALCHVVPILLTDLKRTVRLSLVEQRGTT